MIDWTRVCELRDEIGEEDFAEVVDLFLDEVEGVLDALVPGNGDLESQMHFLKGSALNLGFRAFSALCEEGESQPNSIDINKIKEVYTASRTEFSGGLETRMAS